MSFDPNLPASDRLRVDELLSHRAWLLGLARRLARDDATAHDLAQDALSAAIARPPGPPYADRGFLATIARRAAAKLARGGSRRARREREVAAREAIPSAAELVAEAEAQKAVVEAVLELDEPYRTAVLLRFFRGMKPAAIAAIQGVPVATVDTRLHRALARLRERLDRRFGERRAWCAPLLSAAKAIEVSGAAGASGTAAIAGGILVGTAWKLTVAAGAVAAVLVVSWSSGVLDVPTAGRSPAPEPLRDPPAIAAATQGSRSAAPERAEVPAAVGPQPTPASAAESAFVIVDDVGAPRRQGFAGFERDGRIEVREVDADGRVAFPALRGEVDLAIGSVERPLEVVRVALDPGERTIALPRRSVVAGIVRLADSGAPPRDPIEIRLRATGSAVAPAESLPSPLLRLQLHGTIRPDAQSTRTAADGTFRFAGLPADVHGEVFWLDPRFEGAVLARGPAVRFDGPAEGIVFELVERPAIRGRIVGENRAPLADAELSVRFVSRDGATSTRRFEGRRDGTFECHVPDGEGPWDATIAALAEGGTRRAEVEVREAWKQSVDVGDVVAARGADVPFVVRDERGGPLAGARAYARGGPFAGDSAATAPSAPTDSSGRGSVALLRERETVWFAAVGREVVALEVERDPSRLVAVALGPAAAVEVLARANATAPVPRLTATLESSRPTLFAIPPGEMPFRTLRDLGEDATNLASGQGQISDADVAIDFEIRDGRLRIPRIRPGVPFTLVVRRGEKELLREGPLALAAGETRGFELEAPDEAPGILLRIVDERGRPVPFPSVIVRGAEDESPNFADGEGHVTIGCGYPGPFEVTVIARGFAPLRVAALSRPAPGGEVELRLASGRRVELHVVDAAGRAVSEVETSALGVGGDDERGRFIGFELGAGRYLFDSLPASGPITFDVRIGANGYSVVHDSPSAVATLVVPAYGALEATWDWQLDVEVAPRLHLMPVSGGEERIDDSLTLAPAASGGAHRVRHVLPGRYAVTLEVVAEEGQDEGRVRVLGRGEIDVAEGATAKLALHREGN